MNCLFALWYVNDLNRYRAYGSYGYMGCCLLNQWIITPLIVSVLYPLMEWEYDDWCYFGTGLARCVWLMTALILPEGPYKSMSSQWVFTNTFPVSFLRQRSMSIFPLSTHIYMSQTHTYHNISWRDDGAYIYASTYPVWGSLLPRSCSCGLMPFHLPHCKIGLHCICRLRNAKNPVITVWN